MQTRGESLVRHLYHIRAEVAEELAERPGMVRQPTAEGQVAASRSEAVPDQLGQRRVDVAAGDHHRRDEKVVADGRVSRVVLFMGSWRLVAAKYISWSSPTRRSGMKRPPVPQPLWQAG